MLWLAAVCGLAFWETRRRRANKGKASTSVAPRGASKHFSAASCRGHIGSLLPNGSGRTLALLNQELSALPLDISSVNPEYVAILLREGETALPELCKLLQASTDAQVLAEVTELLALLSPSRRGLQSAICEAGAVPALLRLLTSSAFTRPPGSPYPTAAPGTFLPAWKGPLHVVDGSRAPPGRSRSCHNPSDDQQQEKGHRTGKGKAVSTEHLDVHSGNSSNRGSVKSDSSSSRVSGQGQGPGGEPEKAGAGDGPDGRSARDPVVLLYVLRTLVNLTSNARAGAPVRQAILRDPSAPDTLLSLLHVPEEEEEVNILTGGSAAAVAPAASSGPAAVPSNVPASRWHIAGLAAWLVAHLCSVPAGQMQLVQEGVVPALIRLVRHGRMAWVTAAAERATPGRPRATSAAARTAAGLWYEPSAAQALEALRSGEGVATKGRGANHGGISTAATDAPAARGLGVSYRLMPHASSTLLYDAAAAAAAAAGDSSPRVAAMPYMIAAAQYGLMALVNLTFDNSANQRAVAMSGGMLTELEALFGVLLQPGVLLPRPATAAMPHDASRGPGVGVSRELGAGGGAGDATAGGSDSGGDGDSGWNTSEDVDALLRSGYLGLAKFAVWLLAHLSSSDPDLKADIAGSAYRYVPRLLEFLMLPDADGLPPPPLHHRQQQQQQSGAAATAGVLIVRQYAAMALVNLTCGVPSTKAAVAQAMDWDGMTALLQWLAEETERAAAAATAEAAAAAVAACEPAVSPRVHSPTPAPATIVGPPISDLLLYTVWLLQHLSLSPFAAAFTDPRVIPPLVALLEAPDGHVRLRASAAIGALCSASLPPSDDTAECGLGAAGSGASASAGTAHNPHHVNQQQQPHRAAFLVAGGVRRLLAAARRERDPQLLAYGMLCLSSGVGDDVVAVAEAVGSGALGLLEGLLVSEHPACLLPAAEALQALARGARAGLRRFFGRGATSAHSVAHRQTSAANARAADWAVVAVSSAADHVPRSLLARVVAVMLTHGDTGVRAAMNETLGALTALPGVRERYCAVFAETLRDLVNAAEVELQVIPVN